MSKVKIVAHPETGDIVTLRENEEFGVIRVDQEVTSMEGGFFRSSKRTAWIGGRTEDLKAANFKAGQTLDGKIIRQESNTPFYDGQEPKVYPDGSEREGEVFLKDGQPVYMNDTYTDDLSAPNYSWVGTQAPVEGATTDETSQEGA